MTETMRQTIMKQSMDQVDTFLRAQGKKGLEEPDKGGGNKKIKAGADKGVVNPADFDLS
jgi:hypothetical protein